jgi:hypothetical protein
VLIIDFQLLVRMLFMLCNASVLAMVQVPVDTVERARSLLLTL